MARPKAWTEAPTRLNGLGEECPQCGGHRVLIQTRVEPLGLADWLLCYRCDTGEPTGEKESK